MPAKTGTEAKAKADSAYRNIGEVAELLDVPQHVLRFWETKFTIVRPLKRAGGRRFYSPQDIELLIELKNLLYQQGYTIKGVQRLLRGARGLPSALDLARQHRDTVPPVDEEDTAEAPQARVRLSSTVDPVVGHDDEDVFLAEMLDALRALQDDLAKLAHSV